MTAPRQVLPGTTYLVTRRCARREFLLRPDPMVKGILRYLLAVASERYAVDVHAVCVLSNHVHLVVTDRKAQLPRFSQFLFGLAGRAVNSWLGRWESFWAPSTYSAVRLVSPEDIVAKTAYVLANPVAAGLVRSGSAWPGVWSGPDQIGAGPARVERPDHFFSKKGSMPARTALDLTVPSGFDSAEEFRRLVRAELAVLEAAAIEEHAGRFQGVRKVLAQRPSQRPAGGEPRRALNPRVACRDKWKRIETLGRLGEFARAYRAAFAEWIAGRRDVVFPAGTYKLRVVDAVACAGTG